MTNFNEKHTLHEIIKNGDQWLTDKEIENGIARGRWTAIEKKELYNLIDVYLEEFFGSSRGEEDEYGNDLFEVDKAKFMEMLETDVPMNEWWLVSKFDDATYIVEYCEI